MELATLHWSPPGRRESLGTGCSPGATTGQTSPHSSSLFLFLLLIFLLLVFLPYSLSFP
jgi:hypothetical protein